MVELASKPLTTEKPRVCGLLSPPGLSSAWAWQIQPNRQSGVIAVSAVAMSTQAPFLRVGVMHQRMSGTLGWARLAKGEEDAGHEHRDP